ncbi:MAG: arsenite methyltransferase [Bacteroidetes bacterium]|nr:arsenite methyltransferase [Bacteroidota bacterium]
MQNETQIKELVKEKYGKIAREGGSCGTSFCGDVTNIMADSYSSLEGYNPDADLGLGCGLPTEFPKIKEGDTVIDLGSGAGNDAFIARRIVGEKGEVIGIDITPFMIERANKNAEKLGYENVEFRLGDIDDMPVKDNVADVIVSNCVLNLVPDKEKVIKEIFPTLKPGGHFPISDIVLNGQLPEGLKESAEMYAGCVSGAIQKSEYLNHIQGAGFSNVTLQKEKKIEVPDEILLQYISRDELKTLKKSGTGIYSVTGYAEKPAGAKTCCGPACCN